MNTNTDKTFWRLGLLLATMSAILSGYFGYHQGNNAVQAVCLLIALASAGVGSALILPRAYQYSCEGNKFKMALAIFFGVTFTAMDLLSNFGSIGWQRTANVEIATMQKVRHTDAHKSKQEVEDLLAVLKAQKAKLEARAGWSAAKPTAAYDADIKVMDEAIRQETKRGGCGSKCLALMGKKREVEANKAVAVAYDKNAKKMDATMALLKKTRGEAAQVNYATSAVGSSTAVFAKILTASLDPSKGSEEATNLGVASVIAFFLTFGAMGCIFMSDPNFSTGSAGSGSAGGGASIPSPKEVLEGGTTVLNNIIDRRTELTNDVMASMSHEIAKAKGIMSSDGVTSVYGVGDKFRVKAETTPTQAS